ncbi:MAG: septum formation protein Maf [Deltaproteobacteria bacterium]|nr:septum formation protein Maf [Deltaproteobacteria bacterium]
MDTQRNSSRPVLVLASASPRRSVLLGRLGIRFEIVPSTVEEIGLNGEAPEAQVQRLALSRAHQVSQWYPDMWVLGADTIVVIDGMILGKPSDEENAKAMLATIAGRTHDVYTGYALINATLPEAQRVRYLKSGVKIRELSPEQIEGYVRTGEPMDKAGAYAVQGIGSGIVESISGSYTNVVGLPLCEVARDLKDLGIFDFLKPDCE